MTQTNFDGPLASGNKMPGNPAGANVGLAVLSQTVVLNRDATLVQSGTVNLPVNSQIIDFMVDVLTPYDSATSATLTVGQAAGGSQYIGAVNAKTAGRAAPVLSAAQLAAMANVGTNTALVATVTSVGQPTVGQAQMTVRYVQTA